MSYSANSEYPDEMPLNAAFHQDIHGLLRQNRETIQFYLKIKTCDPSLYRMDRPKLTVSDQMEESISV